MDIAVLRSENKLEDFNHPTFFSLALSHRDWKLRAITVCSEWILIGIFHNCEQKKKYDGAWNSSSDRKKCDKGGFYGWRAEKNDWQDAEINWMPKCGTWLLRVEWNTFNKSNGRQENQLMSFTKLLLKRKAIVSHQWIMIIVHIRFGYSWSLLVSLSIFSRFSNSKKFEIVRTKSLRYKYKMCE